jgi:assimilatory nitrate reductase catalytic subunit
MIQDEVRTTCPYCGVGCGVVVRRDGSGTVIVKGDPAHPANFGRLCSKGLALGETLDHEGRLLRPRIGTREVDWGQALDTVAERFRAVIDAHGPGAVAFYVSGQLLTEDYYVANKLMKGFIGAANIDTNSRLCMSSAVAGYKRAFGSDTVPCSYEDLERAKLIVLTGSNAAWCHPVLFQRILHAKKENPDLMVVVIDPRRTSTCDIADLHLALQPGSDATLFNGLLCHLEQAGERNSLFVQQATEGLEAALAAARADAPDLAAVAARCGLAEAQLQSFYKLFARTERVVTVFSQGVNQFSTGTDKVNSIINCHLLTGRIGRPGMGPFSFTGQPNAMGGREVGGLANQLAAHMELHDPQHRAWVQDFWQSPRIATAEGLKAVDLFEAVHAGKVKALWVMATNPAVSLPDSNRVREALARCEFLVVSDCMHSTDTTRYADVLLPAQTWGERDGMVTNSERRISRQRAFLNAPGEACPDWWILSRVATRMGYSAHFPYSCVADIFREHAALSAHHNQGTRDFDLGALAGMSNEDYAGFEPTQWPVRTCGDNVRLFSDGRFFTASGKARFVPVAGKGPAHAPCAEYPLVLNTGRVRDHWHTMTRTGKSPRLAGHTLEPYAELHAADAARHGIQPGGLVQIDSRWGRVVVRARISDAQRPGSLFVPIHWNQQFSSLASVDQLVSPVTDPISGQPEFKYTPVRIAPSAARWYGFILSRRRLALRHSGYWACARGKDLWRYEIAGSEAPQDWAATARGLLCTDSQQVEWIEFADRATPRYRAARIEGGRLESCVFIGPDIRLPERDWLATLFEQATLDERQRRSLLTGRSDDGRPDAGPLVCACFGVGRNTIIEAIRRDGCTTPEALGNRLKAGTNCGSCLPELRSLILQTKAQ